MPGYPISGTYCEECYKNILSTDVGLDIQDDQGRHEVGFVNNTQKTPIMEGNGCLFEANFVINKVPGKDTRFVFYPRLRPRSLLHIPDAESPLVLSGPETISCCAVNICLNFAQYLYQTCN